MMTNGHGELRSRRCAESSDPSWTAAIRSLAACAVALIIATPIAANADDTAPQNPGPTVDYGTKGLVVQSSDGDFKLGLLNYVQPRFEFVRVDEGPDEASTRARFLIRRARTTLKGHIFGDSVNFKMVADWGGGSPKLEDAYIDFALERDWFWIRVGQMKRPTSRQLLASSTALQLVDRAVTSSAFGESRDVGLMIHNQLSGSFEYALGLFNGTGSKSRFSGSTTVDPVTLEGEVSGSLSNIPATFRPLLTARLAYHFGDIKGYVEPDLDGGGARFGLGASGYRELDVDQNDAQVSGGSFDLIFKAAGFSLSGAAFLRLEEEPNGEVFAVGAYGQLGYMLGGSGEVMFEPVARYSRVDPRGPNNALQTAGGGLDVYFYGRRLTLKTDAFAVMEETQTVDLTNVQIRSEVQIQF